MSYNISFIKRELESPFDTTRDSMTCPDKITYRIVTRLPDAVFESLLAILNIMWTLTMALP